MKGPTLSEIFAEQNATLEVGKPGGPRIYMPGCTFCDRERLKGNEFFPSHYAMPSCESGKKDHCTCDTCF